MYPKKKDFNWEKGMRVAVVQTYFIKGHYECFGFFLAYAKQFHPNMDFYLPLRDCTEWLLFYEKIGVMPGKHKIHDVQNFPLRESDFAYDIIIMLNDHDRFIEHEFRDKPPINRLVTVLHSPQTTRYANARSVVQLSVRPMYSTSTSVMRMPNGVICTMLEMFPLSFRHVFPVFRPSIDIPPVQAHSFRRILVVTSFPCDCFDYEAVSGVAADKDMQLTICGRANSTSFVPLLANTRWVCGASTEQLFTEILDCDVVLVPRTEGYIHTQLSGIIPLAISYLRPLFLPHAMSRALFPIKDAPVGTYNRSKGETLTDALKAFRIPQVEHLKVFRERLIDEGETTLTRVLS